MFNIDIYTRCDDGRHFHHNYCGRSEAYYYGTKNNHNFCCMPCGMFYVLPDNKILSKSNRELIYYSEGNILWIKYQKPQILTSSIPNLYVEQKYSRDIFNFSSLRFLHECNNHTLSEVTNAPPILTCKSCNKEIDLNSQGLLTAIFSASISVIEFKENCVFNKVRKE